MMAMSVIGSGIDALGVVGRRAPAAILLDVAIRTGFFSNSISN